MFFAIQLLLFSLYFLDLLLFSAILMELAAQSAKGICHDMLPNIDELSPIIRLFNLFHYLLPLLFSF